MIVVGLTGSIGMGKTTAAAMLRRLGMPLFEADACVHRLLAPGGAAVAPVAAAFSGVLGEAGGIDRTKLGRLVFGNPKALQRLEGIVHPLVRAAEQRFLRDARIRRAPLAVLDLPLLYETGGDRRCDCVIVVSAPAFLQRQRVLRRLGSSDSRLNAILAAQMPDHDKRRRADFVVPTGLGKGATLRRLKAIVRVLEARHGRG